MSVWPDSGTTSVRRRVTLATSVASATGTPVPVRVTATETTTDGVLAGSVVSLIAGSVNCALDVAGARSLAAALTAAADLLT